MSKILNTLKTNIVSSRHILDNLITLTPLTGRRLHKKTTLRNILLEINTATIHYYFFTGRYLGGGVHEADSCLHGQEYGEVLGDEMRHLQGQDPEVQA